MKKIILWILFGMVPILFQAELLRAQSVSISTNTYPVKAGGNSCTGSETSTSNCKDLITETKDGSSDSPHQAYIPVYNSNNSNHLYSLLWDGGDGTGDLPFYDSSSEGNNSGHIVTQLLVKGSSGKTTLYLHGGVLNQERTSFRPYKDISADYFEKFEDYEDIVIGNRYVTLNLATLCQNQNFSNCANEIVTHGITPSNAEAKVVVFFFLSKKEELQSEADIALTSDDVEGPGVFVEYRMRNYVYTDTRVTLNEVHKGDLRLTVDYEREDITEPYALVAYSPHALFSGGGTYADATSATNKWTQRSVILSPAKSSEMDIFPLANDATYDVSLTYVDKWQFATKFTDSIEGKTEKLNVFLEQQSCYFISAGFKEKHFVLDYFRSIRDEILLKSVVGRIFVKFYYRTAPYYAQNYIYPSKVLSFLVRFFSYILYYFLTNLAFVLLILSGMAFWLISKRKGRKKMTPW